MLIFAKLIVFSQEDRGLLERMIEAWEHLCTVDIIYFVNELVIDCVNFSKEIVFSQVVVIGADRLEQMMFEAPLCQVDIIDGFVGITLSCQPHNWLGMIEAWEHLRTVNIIDFVNKLVIDCVHFCKNDCVFTGGQ